MATDSADNRRATNASACADSRSNHCASSTTQRSGPASAASETRLSTARPTRKRSGGDPMLSPKTVSRASRWGAGRHASRSSSGTHSWCSPANGSSISDSTAAARTTLRSDAESIAYSSSAVLPMPGLPRTTSAALCPPRTLSSRRSSVSHSVRRPRSVLSPRPSGCSCTSASFGIRRTGAREPSIPASTVESSSS